MVRNLCQDHFRQHWPYSFPIEKLIEHVYNEGSNPIEPVIVLFTHVIRFCFSETGPEIESKMIHK